MLSFTELEDKVLAKWQKQDIFKKSLQKPSPKGTFVFWEGPPTANGKPGLHHVLARAFKDLIPRYKTMRGYKVERKAGWDTQGLPVELQVEKELQFKGKPDIEKYGVKEFNARCKEDVWKYKADWEKLTERMGYWLDLEHPYVTYDNSYIESLWWILKQVWNAGLLYQDYKVLPHCPRCGTALSSHEVAQGYKSVEDKAVYVKFKTRNPKPETRNLDTYILSWTTTPWTLPGNVALAVGKKIVYVKVKLGDEYVIISKERLSVLADQSYKIVEEILGSDLVGLEYEPLFDIKPLQNDKSYRVYAADFVTTTDGTGVVHTAVMYGEEDFNLGTQVGLPKYHTVDEAGKFTSDVPQWAGKFVKNKEVEQEIIADLASRGLLFKQELYTHDYPFCWRCSTPLLYYAKPSWFIKMSALREDLKAANEQVNWYPDHIKHGRFGEWLEGVKDWAISRERYWGTPLPIWVCEKCKETKVVGSFKELVEFSGDKNLKARISSLEFDPHRPFIDEIVFPCKCGGTMKRVPEVADCWFDSGSMPLAQIGYPHLAGSDKQLEQGYPADYIAEAIDQTRGWFYTLLAVATLLKKAGVIKELPPYKNVICLGHINDKNGQKMSKSKGNIVDPWEIINKYGVDALRFHLYTGNQPGEPKNFDPKNVDEVVKKTFLILFNVLAFYEMYSGEAVASSTTPQSEYILDKWVLTLWQKTLYEVTNHLEAYQITEAGRKLAAFVTELSTWYVRRSRERFKEGGQSRQGALTTLGFLLRQLAIAFAPFTPFITEELYARIKGSKESVHLEDWPEAKDISAEQSTLLTQMQTVRSIVEQVLAQRSAAGIKVRQPLRCVTITGFDLAVELKDILSDEVNVLEVVVKPGSELGVELDIAIDDELKAQGRLREFVRQVNALRKKQGLTIKDRPTLNINADESSQKIFEVNREVILKSALLKDVVFTTESYPHILEIEGASVTVQLA